MSRPENRSSGSSLLGSLAWPLVIGLGATAAFYMLLYRGPLHHPLMMRYFAGHPINMIETGMFFVGCAALALKLFEVLGQSSAMAKVSLADADLGQPATKASQWLDGLANLPAAARNSYLGRRLADALEGVERRGTADNLEEDLKYLADVDAGKAHDSYGLVRIIIWAIPMLGFLGTVVGITEALGDLGRQELGAALDSAIKGLTDGLYVAFDTTAIALCFSIVLMFIQFMLDRHETEVLSSVEQRASHELAGRFEVTGSTSDPQLAAIQRMSQAVVKATETLVQKQVELWQQSIVAARDQSQRLAQQTTEQMQAALSAALNQSLAHHSAQLAKIEETSSQHLAQRWEQWQTALSQNARLLHAQQTEMVRQGELLNQAIKATGDVVQLERALNDNLAALAGSKNFEDTVMSLSAAIHLLSTRLGKPDAPHVELKSPLAKGRAA
ncbi:MAG: MotA/TolQ/ExbB proton channel family protein [Pirellulaceae bacterium]|nr:MotA/TolQ/ExbB proton channel family protein [Pirellulaceae bacterium]